MYTHRLRFKTNRRDIIPLTANGVIYVALSLSEKSFPQFTDILNFSHL
jgi:hypothetical protein